MFEYIEKYHKKDGLYDLEKIINDSSYIITEHLHENYKKIVVIHAPNGMLYYAKPLKDTREASAELILSKLYQLHGFISPETYIAERCGVLYAITNDVLPSHNTERGYKFLETMCPAGAQYVLPDLFERGEKSGYYKRFKPELIPQIAKYYGFALGTKNYDANYCNLNFRFFGKEHEIAEGIVSIDYGKSQEQDDYWAKYVNPFEPKRTDWTDLWNDFRQVNEKHPELVKKREISESLEKGAKQIKKIAREEADKKGFKPDADYVEKVEESLSDTGMYLK